MSLVGIIGAMEEEVSKLKEQMIDVSVKEKAGMEFFRGTLSGKPVVVVRSGIGKVNAGICTQILVDDYHIDYVINTGIACSMTWMLSASDIRWGRFPGWIRCPFRPIRDWWSWRRKSAEK